MCFDTNSDLDGDSTLGDMYVCTGITGETARATCTNWESFGSGGIAVAGSDGDVQVKSGTALGAGTGLNIASRVGTFTAKYLDFDTNGDGTPDERWVGDYDGDGTLELTDVESGIEGALGAGRKSIVIMPGTYTGGFRTTINITQPNVSIRGSGREATYLDITGDASGNSDALDDGADGAVDSRYLFLVAANNVEFSDFSVDGGSNRYLVSMTDANADGTKDCKPTQVSPGGTCDNTGWCCPDTHDIILLSATYTNLTVRNVDIRRADRVAVATLPSPVGTSYINVSDSYFNGMGERALTIHGSDALVRANTFENCGGSDCILLPVPEQGTPINRIVVSGNVFRNFGQWAISTETTSQFESDSFYDVTITDNVISSAYTNAMGEGGIDVSGAQDLDGDGTATYLLPSRLVIADNQIYLPAAENPAIIVGGVTTANSAGDIQIRGNRIYFDPDSDYPVGQTKSVIYALADTVQVNGNQVELDNATGFNAINLAATSSIAAKHVQANDNQIAIHEEQNYGIFVSTSNVQINGTHCYTSVTDAAAAGNLCIGVVDGSAATPENVTITNTTVDGGWYIGVYVGTSAGVVVDGVDCYDLEPDGTAAHGNCVYAIGASEPLLVRNITKHQGGGYLARNNTAGIGRWENLTCYGTCTCVGTNCMTGSGLEYSITVDPEFNGGILEDKPWLRVESFDDCGANAANAKFGNMSYAADVTDADPQTSSTAQGLCRSAAVGVGSDGYGVAWAGTAATASNTATVQAGKLINFAARVRQTGSSGGSLSSGRKLIGGVLHGAAADMTVPTNGAFFWACPQCDIDGDGSIGDGNDDGDCGDAGEDSGDCNWWAVTGTGLTWGCLTGSVVSVDCDDDGTAESAIAGTVTYEDTGVSAVTAVMREFEIKCAAWNSSGQCTSYAYYIDGALEATHTTGAPTTTKIWGWSAWIEGSGSGSSYFGYDWIYYRGRR